MLKPLQDKPRHKVIITLISLAVIGLASLIFAIRYPAAFSVSNFYAEDGSVLTASILNRGIFGGTLTLFNGYLVVGQYVLADMAYIVLRVLHLPFYALPTLYAGVSCLFLGLTASLPFLLFRKQLGRYIALATAAVTTFVPMPSSDYAIIGTLGNLKFAFMYWAFLFIIYRNLHHQDTNKLLVSDAVLLISVLTYAPALALLPVLLIPYRREIISALRAGHIPKTISRGLFQALVLLILCAIYVLFIYIHGIPPTAQGYLDTPYQWHASIKLLYRSTIYTWLFPYTSGLNDYSVLIILGLVLSGALYYNKERRFTFVFGLWAIVVATISFVANRTGLSSYFLAYTFSPDQFFYTQNMIAIFITAWIISAYVKTTHQAQLVGILAIGYLLLTAGLGTTFGKNKAGYVAIGTARQNIEQVCRHDSTSKIVTYHIYPVPNWLMQVDRAQACNK